MSSGLSVFSKVGPLFFMDLSVGLDMKGIPFTDVFYFQHIPFLIRDPS